MVNLNMADLMDSLEVYMKKVKNITKTMDSLVQFMKHTTTSLDHTILVTNMENFAIINKENFSN